MLLDKIKRGAMVLLNDFVTIPGGFIVPPNVTLEDYFTEIKLEHGKFMFPLESRSEIKEKGVVNKPQRSKELVQKASMRLVYRCYLLAYMCLYYIFLFQQIMLCYVFVCLLCQLCRNAPPVYLSL